MGTKQSINEQRKTAAEEAQGKHLPLHWARCLVDAVSLQAASARQAAEHVIEQALTKLHCKGCLCMLNAAYIVWSTTCFLSCRVNLVQVSTADTAHLDPMQATSGVAAFAQHDQCHDQHVNACWMSCCA